MSCGFVFRGVQLGLGQHFEDFKSKEDVTDVLRLNYVYQILFDVGVAFAKVSALLFYRRVFASRSKAFNVAHGVTFALVAAFILYKLPTQIFSCVPPRKNWEPEIEGHCENDYTDFRYLMAGLVLDVLTDLFILLLPIPLIAKLHTTKKRKLALIGAFVLGSMYVDGLTSHKCSQVLTNMTMGNKLAHSLRRSVEPSPSFPSGRTSAIRISPGTRPPR